MEVLSKDPAAAPSGLFRAGACIVRSRVQRIHNLASSYDFWRKKGAHKWTNPLHVPHFAVVNTASTDSKVFLMLTGVTS